MLVTLFAYELSEFSRNFEELIIPYIEYLKFLHKVIYEQDFLIFKSCKFNMFNYVLKI